MMPPGHGSPPSVRARATRDFRDAVPASDAEYRIFRRLFDARRCAITLPGGIVTWASGWYWYPFSGSGLDDA
jgi:hypothetical protein